MGYDWRHEVSREWMQARKNFLTATELASCISAWKRITKRQLAGIDPFPAFAKLWAKKYSDSEPDTWSKGPAARGHILEPYAVEDWNKNCPKNSMYHWDDCMIATTLGLGWSPDALNIPQASSSPLLWRDGDALTDGKIHYASLPTKFLEIKSYEPNKIIEARMKDKMKLDERWQIACGFWLLDTIEEANLLFYSIDTPLSFYVTYTREDLHDELEQVSDMVRVWVDNMHILDNMLVSDNNKFKRSVTEEQVYDEWLESQEDVFSF